MDKQSRTISVKVNGTKAKYEEKKKEKEELEWSVVNGTTPPNVVPFQKNKMSLLQHYKKKWSNVLIFTIATAIIIGTVLGMGMLHLLTGQDADQGAAVTNIQNDSKIEEPAVAEKKEEVKPTEKQAAALAPLTVYFVQGGVYSTKEKGQAAIQEWKDKGSAAAIKPQGDKYSLVIGLASDEQSVNQLIGHYKQEGIPVVKKKWEITDQALLKNEKGTGDMLEKLQVLYVHFIAYTAYIQSEDRNNAKEIAEIEKEWQAIEKESKSIKGEELKKVYTYASIGWQTIQEEKNDKETLAKLNQVIIDGLLSYEKIVSQKAE